MPHLHALLRTAVRLCRERARGEDLVQETMLRAWACFHQFEPGTSAKGWLFTIMLNLWKRTGSRLARWKALVAGSGDPEAGRVAAPRSSEQQVFANEVLAAVDSLPAEQSTVLLLSVVEGFAVREIAAMLKVPQGTVMSRVARARAELRQRFSPQLPRNATYVPGRKNPYAM